MNRLPLSIAEIAQQGDLWAFGKCEFCQTQKFLVDTVLTLPSICQVCWPKVRVKYPLSAKSLMALELLLYNEPGSWTVREFLAEINWPSILRKKPNRRQQRLLQEQEPLIINSLKQLDKNLPYQAAEFRLRPGYHFSSTEKQYLRHYDDFYSSKKLKKRKKKKWL